MTRDDVSNLADAVAAAVEKHPQSVGMFITAITRGIGNKCTELQCSHNQLESLTLLLAKRDARCDGLINDMLADESSPISKRLRGAVSKAMNKERSTE